MHHACMHLACAFAGNSPSALRNALGCVSRDASLGHTLTQDRRQFSPAPLALHPRTEVEIDKPRSLPSGSRCTDTAAQILRRRCCCRTIHQLHTDTEPTGEAHRVHRTRQVDNPASMPLVSPASLSLACSHAWPVRGAVVRFALGLRCFRTMKGAVGHAQVPWLVLRI